MEQIFDAKNQPASYNLTFSFLSMLPLNVSISSAAVQCTVVSGVDPSPSSVVGTPAIVGSGVRIPVTAGVIGVIYNIRVLATGSDSKVYEVTGKLAVIA